MLCVVFHVFVQLMNKTSEQFVGSCILNVINRDMKCKKKPFRYNNYLLANNHVTSRTKSDREIKISSMLRPNKKSKLNYKLFDIIPF
jgi:hypothetical protein